MKRWLMVLAVLSIAQLVFSFFKLNESGLNLPDLVNSYYRSGTDLRQGIIPYNDTKAIMVYPPPALLLFACLPLLPLTAVSWLWTLFSLAALGLAVVLLTAKREDRWLFLALSLFSFPVKFTLGMGQINHFILLLVALCWFFYRKKRKAAAGIFLGLSLLLKLTPLLLPAFFLIKKEFKVLSAALGIWLAGWLASYLLLGEKVVEAFFLKVLPSLAGQSWGNSFYYNQSLSATWARLFGLGREAGVVYLLLAGGFY